MTNTSGNISWIEAERQGDDYYARVSNDPASSLEWLSKSGLLFILALKDAESVKAPTDVLIRLNRKLWRHYRKSPDFGCALAERDLKAGLSLLERTHFVEEWDMQLERARLYLERVYCAMDAEQVSLAQKLAAQAWEILRQPLLANNSDARSEEGKALQMMAIARREAGDRDGFDELMQEASLSFMRSGDVISEVDHALNIGREQLLWGTTDAIRYLENNLERISAQAPSRLPKVKLHLALAYLDRKDFEVALKFATQTIDLLKDTGDIIDQSLAYECLAEVYKELAIASIDLQKLTEYSNQTRVFMNRGLGILQKLPTVAGKINIASFQYQLHRMQAELALTRGNLNFASDELEKADQIHDKYQLDLALDAVGDVRRTYSCLYKLSGKPQLALSTLDEVRELYISNECEGKVIQTNIERANLQIQLGQFEYAEASLNEALALSAKLKRDWDEKKIHIKLEELQRILLDRSSEKTSDNNNQNEPLNQSELDQPIIDSQHVTEERNKLASLLNQFFDRPSIDELCFKLGIDLDELHGETKSEKSRSLIRFIFQHGRENELKRHMCLARPNLCNQLFSGSVR